LTLFSLAIKGGINIYILFAKNTQKTAKNVTFIPIYAELMRKNEQISPHL
jgi:hypothetical protein